MSKLEVRIQVEKINDKNESGSFPSQVHLRAYQRSDGKGKWKEIGNCDDPLIGRGPMIMTEGSMITMEWEV